MRFDLEVEVTRRSCGERRGVKAEKGVARKYEI